MSTENKDKDVVSNELPNIQNEGCLIPEKIDYWFSEADKKKIILEYEKKTYEPQVEGRRFVNLHSHTTYSNAIKLDAYGTLDQVLERTKDIKSEFFAVTDHWIISSFFNLIKMSKKSGITPILWCELYVVDSIELQNQYKSQKKSKSNKWETDDEALQQAVSKDSIQRYHLVAIAENTKWLKNLYKLISYAWTKWFYYRPSVDWKFLEEHKEGLIFSSACEGWYPIAKMRKVAANGGNEADIIKEWERALMFMNEKLSSWKNVNFFSEIIPIWNSRKMPLELYKNLYKASKNVWIPMIATCDSHYPNKEDYVYQDILLAIWDNKKFYDPERRKYPEWQFYNRHFDEMLEDMLKDYWDVIPEQEIRDMLELTYQIALRVKSNKIKMPEAPIVKFPLEEGSDNIYVLFKRLINDWWKWRNMTEQLKKYAKKKAKSQEEYVKYMKEISDEYKERLDKEYDCIMKKWFIDYFLIVKDLIQEARDRGYVVGPWRWSAAGSLICYLLWITEVDPIPYDLFFERFIDFNRWDTLYTIEHPEYTISDFEKEVSEEERNEIQKNNNWYESLYDDIWNDKPQDEKRFSLIIQADLNKLLEEQPELKENKILTQDQIIRESWLITHPINTLSAYAMKLREKIMNNELAPMQDNEKNSWWLYAIWATNQIPTGDFVCKLTDIPDIDIDFQDDKRDDVIFYLRDRYWHDNFAYIATFMEMKGKWTLRDIARIFNIPLTHMETISKLLIQRSWWDSRASFTLMDTLEQFKDIVWHILEEYPEIRYAWKLEWQIRQMWMHASWIIVHNDPLYEYGWVYTRKWKEIICWDKKASESIWLMKMDVLWLQNLNIIKVAIDLIKKRTWTEIIPYKIPMDDPLTYEWFQQVKLFWIFQFDWDSAASIARQLKMKNFKEVYDCTALCLAEWTNITMKTGEEKIENLFSEYKNKKKVENKIISYDFEMENTVENNISEIFDQGEQDIYEIILEDWSSVKATENHKFFTNNWWKKLKDINPEIDILFVKK